uniref:ABC transporter substrate-binding protein n=1 Tax=Bosea sp. NBC_00436 TaxID=2969620 RepID=A0A9E8A9T7_9HYPH
MSSNHIGGIPNRRQVLLGASALAVASGTGAALAAEPFRIGAPNSVTGAAAAFGTEIQNTINALAKEINAIGGPAGAPFEVFSEDSQTLPEPALLAAKKLIEVNKVRALLGVQTSPEALAIIPASNAADVMLFHTGSAPKLLTQNEKGLGFSFAPSSARYGRAYFDFVEKEGFKKPASLILTNDASIGNARSFTEIWAAKYSSEPPAVQYQPNQPSYRAEIQKIMSSNPDIILLHGYELDATIIIRQLFEVGYTGKIITPEFAATARLIKVVGKDPVEGIYVLKVIPNTGASSYKMFQEFIGRVGKQAVEGTWYAAVAYDQLNLLALAIEKAGPGATNAQIAAAVPEISNPDAPLVSSFAEGREKLRAGAKRLNYDGASSPCDFDAKGTTPAIFGISVIKEGAVKSL